MILIMQHNRNVLVTGGAGFIGSHIADKLISNKYKVVVIDNLSAGNKSNVNPKAIFIKGDIRDKKLTKRILKKNQIATVFHLAGQPSIINSFKNPQEDIDINFLGTINVLLASIECNITRFVYASSMTVYGNPTTLPITEATPCIPINYYGVSKYAAERFVHITAASMQTNKLNVTSFRMFNVYGPRQSLNNPYQGVLAIFLGNILRGEPITIYGDGKQARDFIFVDDVAETWVKIIENKKSFNKVYNLGNGKKTSVVELAKTLILTCGKDPKTYPIVYEDARPGDQKIIEADITLTKRDLDLKLKYDLKNGLAHTMNWAKEQQR